MFFRTLHLTKLKNLRAFVEARKMSNMNKGMPLVDIVSTLNKFADKSLAASWDNVGLLIEPSTPKPVSHVLLTNDLTEAVMDEAIDKKVDLIISYHPPIFAPLKSITTRTWKERIAAKCLENRIAIYSPHTSFDSVKGGVNDWLASAFEIDTSIPIEKNQNVEEYGMGRLCTLKNEVHYEKAVELVKKHTGLKHVRLAKSCHKNDQIRTIAVCAGSGTQVVRKVQADLYLTGEMFHHDILNAVHNGTHVILTNHSDSERGFLKEFATTLSSSLNNCVQVSLSAADADPLVTV